MRVFVTGVSGYAGFYAALRLAATGHSVTGLVRNPEQPRLNVLRVQQVTLLHGDVCQIETYRAELERSVASKEDFYRSLEQSAEIAPVNGRTLARVAQLTQKTNQFNLTTRRYTEQQMEQMMTSPEWLVRSLKVTDRYADNGLVGVAIAKMEGEVCEIDTFLMSCRVIGRTVETALLSRLAADARERGVRVLKGWFLPTKKNVPAREFYREHGFEEAARTGEGGVLWQLDLSVKSIEVPEWIRIT